MSTDTSPQHTGIMTILREQSGNIMPIAAIAMVALAGLVGGGVDMSRAYMVQNRLQNACDAGVLAGRRAVGTNGFDDAAEEQANAFFDTNFDEANEDVTGTNFAPTSSDRGNTVSGTASTTIDTVVMRLFGYEEIPLSVVCSASMSVGNSDVMMVLDVTGSMACTSAMSNSQCVTYISGNGYSETAHGGNSRLKDLRNAMKSFYDTVKAATAGSNARIRYGFVPYSSSVNVGKLLVAQDDSYVADNWTYQSRVPQYRTETKAIFAGYEDPIYSEETGYTDVSYGAQVQHSTMRHRNESDCIAARPSNSSWTNSGGAVTSTDVEINSSAQRITTTTTAQLQSQTIYFCARQGNRWYVWRQSVTRYQYESDIATENPEYTYETISIFTGWRYKAVPYDTSVYKALGTVSLPLGGSGAALNSAVWRGCIEERHTVSQATFSWNSITGFSPDEAYDLDIDMAPDSGDVRTQWRPLWPDVAYYRTSTSTGTRAANVPESDWGRKPAWYCPTEARLLGAMTETNFDAYADSLLPSGSTYHNLGMVWGARLSSPQGIFEDNVTSAPSNGGAVARHIIFMTDGQMAPNDEIYSSYGFEAHDERVIGFGSTDSNHAARHTQRFLAACAATKAKGIRVWVIAFSSALTSDLANCASTDSSYTASNAAQLNAAFQEIAKNVGELRITQ